MYKELQNLVEALKGNQTDTQSYDSGNFIYSVNITHSLISGFQITIQVKWAKFLQILEEHPAEVHAEKLDSKSVYVTADITSEECRVPIKLVTMWSLKDLKSECSILQLFKVYWEANDYGLLQIQEN